MYCGSTYLVNYGMVDNPIIVIDGLKEVLGYAELFGDWNTKDHLA